MQQEERDILNRDEMRSNPFGTPAGYFESLEGSVWARINNGEGISAERARAKVCKGRITGFKGIGAIHWNHIIRSTASLAASFAIILALGYGVIELTRSLAPGEAASEISAQRVGDTTIVPKENNSASEMESETDSEELSPMEQYLVDSGISVYAIASAE